MKKSFRGAAPNNPGHSPFNQKNSHVQLLQKRPDRRIEQAVRETHAGGNATPAQGRHKGVRCQSGRSRGYTGQNRTNEQEITASSNHLPYPVPSSPISIVLPCAIRSLRKLLTTSRARSKFLLLLITMSAFPKYGLTYFSKVGSTWCSYR